MTTLPHTPTVPRRLPLPPLMQAAAAFVLAGSLTLPLILFDTRLLDSETLWLKPLKFALSLALFLATLDLAARRLPTPIRQGRWLRAWGWVAIVTATLEFVWIAGAAAMGTRSHYNVTEPLLQAIYQTVMGPIAVALTLSAAAYGATLLRHGWGEVERAAGWGFIATAALTIPTALALANMPVQTPGLPLLGWTLAPGDMRPAHFLATHAMQIVPLAALALAKWGKLPFGTGRALTVVYALPTLAVAAYGMGWL